MDQAYRHSPPQVGYCFLVWPDYISGGGDNTRRGLMKMLGPPSGK
ncbi:hypothetical protein THTE_2831 [Thermogutta terrifontis]|uniref:Uncharacterized protein n=1 Tax=Thermogutta terrifontis TaxID=1331910 RepID=A0A286RHK1_9BACT|nr:hypothetical protein THTE_2831 [Thermogutta terrifontis]